MFCVRNEALGMKMKWNWFIIQTTFSIVLIKKRLKSENGTENQVCISPFADNNLTCKGLNDKDCLSKTELFQRQCTSNYFGKDPGVAFSENLKKFEPIHYHLNDKKKNVFCFACSVSISPYGFCVSRCVDNH